MRRARKINPSKPLPRRWCRVFLTRLLSRVVELPAPVGTKLKSPCWVWQGYTDSQGYGQVSYLGKPCWVHRVAYSLMRGAIPAGMEIGHRCRCRSCLNPAHLKKTPVAVNRRDVVRKECIARF